ncbi:unnamed protein product [Peniophora sp. CBMAI 1063]|nr:unnamed protein product [Peniophora sp. CBMAI 1063]
MSANDDVRERIIASVFSRRNATGATVENYISHVKVWEDSGNDADGLKPRFILLSQDISGHAFIHKSKLNSNGTFSVGKTWQLQELRGLEVMSGKDFNITLARTYRWQTEDPNDQANFLVAIVQLYQTMFGSTGRLRLVNVPSEAPAPTPQARPPGRNVNGRAPAETAAAVNPAARDPRVFDASSRPRVDSRRAPPSEPSTSRAPSPAARRQAPSPTPPPARERPPRAERPGESSYRPSAASSAYGSVGRQSAAPTDTTSRTSMESSLNPPSSRFAVQSSSSVTSLGSTSTATGLHPSAADTPRRRSPSPSAAPTVTKPPPPSSRARGQDPSRRPSPAAPEPLPQRRDQNARISYFDPANQAALDRMLASDLGGGEEEQSNQDTLASVEEMLEGYEWATDTVLGGNKAKGTVDQIEARLMDELMALEKANMYSFIESDERVNLVLNFLDEAIAGLDSMESQVSSYKIHLNAVNEDISFIQSQNRGLQVQTQNQRALLSELENLLQTVQVPRELLVMLTQESLEKTASIERLEGAAAELYKALQAGRDRDMAATMERLDEYRTHNQQFCKRIYDYLSIIFVAQSKMLLGDSDGLVKRSKGTRLIIKEHKDVEVYLGRYSGLILYLKEMDEVSYAKLCAAYFSTASELHSTQIKALMAVYSGMVKKPSEEEAEQTFALTPGGGGNRTANPLKRAGTLVRSPLENRRDRDKPADGDMEAAAAFGRILEAISPQIYREQEFIADFLQINEAGLTFADYMGLENYFRRQAARTIGLSQQTLKLVRGAMDLIFGFLPLELKAWIDGALVKDNLQLIGVIACLERFIADADERGNAFLINALDKQHRQLKSLFDRHVGEQIKSIEETKLTSKKRNGVAQFIKYFPVYVGRVEQQLVGADTLEIRQTVDVAYEKIVQTMFDSLKQMAKLDGEGEDKGQLNYHVILIENMHHFVAEIRQQEIGSVGAFSKRAQDLYEENLAAYVKLVLRRPFAKIIEYFDGVERLLKTTAPTEVANNSSYNRSALKKVVKEYDAKDVRKHVDTLFKRVEKHFTEASEAAVAQSTGIAPGTVLVGVWKACEEELLRITDVFNKHIAQCYASTGVSLEYTAVDVEAAFKRHRVGS